LTQVFQYSGKDIPTLEPDIDDRIVELISLIRAETAKGKLVDMARLSQYFTLDVLTRIAFGAPFGYLTRNEDVYHYIKQTTAFLSILELASNFTFINNILSSRLMRPFAPKTTDKSGMGAMLGVAKDVVAERYAPDARIYPDMMGSFLKCGLSQQEAESEAMLTILGGSDSTATAIRMTLLYVLTSPSAYVKLIAELDANVDSDSKPLIEYAVAKKLPYLQACIKEGLRMWPPFAGLQTKIAPPGGETVNGVFLPGGIEIGYNQHSTMRRKEVFGADVNVFRPERWLEGVGEQLHEMERTLDMVFGSGRFSCLGKDVALMELSKIFPALLGEFEWSVVNPVKAMNTVCWGAHVQSDFLLSVRERGN
jgi:cytochrome P450